MQYYENDYKQSILIDDKKIDLQMKNQEDLKISKQDQSVHTEIAEKMDNGEYNQFNIDES